MQENQGIEIKLSPFYKVICVALFLIMGCGVGGGFMLAPIFPQLMGAADDIANGSLLTKILVSFGGCAILLLFAYPIWVASFRVRADDQGLTAVRGTRTTFIPWQKVASYSMEDTLKWYQPRYYQELVLRDSDFHILFRLPAQMLTADEHVWKNGGNFWRFLQQKLHTKPTSESA